MKLHFVKNEKINKEYVSCKSIYKKGMSSNEVTQLLFAMNDCHKWFYRDKFGHKKFLVKYGDFMKKIIFYAFVLFCFSSVVCFAQKSDTRYVAKGGVFSVNIPDNWELVERGLVHKVLVTKPDKNFTPNISFIDNFVMDIEDLKGYADYYLEQLNWYDAVKIISRDDFETTSAIKGEKVVCSFKQDGLAIRQVFYFLQLSGNKRIMIICSASESSKDKYDIIYEKTVKSFESK
ncbi:hypothetical protein AGMMS50212_09470 [Spirochaetia bacterium]|nr:hypothetical protein AGMMS50212_09470 [Spirochaetia bacterium]